MPRIETRDAKGRITRTFAWAMPDGGIEEETWAHVDGLFCVRCGKQKLWECVSAFGGTDCVTCMGCGADLIATVGEADPELLASLRIGDLKGTLVRAALISIRGRSDERE